MRSSSTKSISLTTPDRVFFVSFSELQTAPADVCSQVSNSSHGFVSGKSQSEKQVKRSTSSLIAFGLYSYPENYQWQSCDWKIPSGQVQVTFPSTMLSMKGFRHWQEYWPAFSLSGKHETPSLNHSSDIGHCSKHRSSFELVSKWLLVIVSNSFYK